MDSIGRFIFTRLDGNIAPLLESVELVARPGVDGVGIYRTGKRGQPFTLRSMRDVSDLDQGRGLYIEYQELVGANGVAIEWSGLSITGRENFTAAVLAVRQVSLRPCRGIGGISGISGALLVCEWDLIGLANT